MFEICANIIILTLSLIGLTAVIKYISLWLLTPKSRGSKALILLLTGDRAEFILNAEIERLRWETLSCNRQIIAIDCGLDINTKKVCEIIAEDANNVVFCRPADVTEIINNL